MTDTATLTPSVAKVLTALVNLGTATAAATAEKAGFGYSTTTPKLRQLEQLGMAEAVRDNGRTLWQPTDAGRTATGHPTTGASTVSSDQPTTDEAPDHADTAPEQPTGDTSPADQPAPFDDGPADGDNTSPATHDAASEPVPVPHPQDTATSSDPDTTPDSPGRPDSDEPVEATSASPNLTDAASPDPAAGDGSDAVQAAPASPRRRKGALREALLAVLHANPDGQHTVAQLCKLVDERQQGTGAAKASAGAVHNAMVKLVELGTAQQTVERPATFALPPAASNGN